MSSRDETPSGAEALERRPSLHRQPAALRLWIPPTSESADWPHPSRVLPEDSKSHLTHLQRTCGLHELLLYGCSCMAYLIDGLRTGYQLTRQWVPWTPGPHATSTGRKEERRVACLLVNQPASWLVALPGCLACRLAALVTEGTLDMEGVARGLRPGAWRVIRHPRCLRGVLARYRGS